MRPVTPGQQNQCSITEASNAEHYYTLASYSADSGTADLQIKITLTLLQEIQCFTSRHIYYYLPVYIMLYVIVTSFCCPTELKCPYESNINRSYYEFSIALIGTAYKPVSYFNFDLNLLNLMHDMVIIFYGLLLAFNSMKKLLRNS